MSLRGMKQKKCTIHPWNSIWFLMLIPLNWSNYESELPKIQERNSNNSYLIWTTDKLSCWNNVPSNNTKYHIYMMHLVQLLTTCQWHSPSVLSKKRSALLVFFCFIYFLKFYERMNVFFLQLVFKRQRNGHHTILPWKASEKKCHSRCQTLWGLWGVVSQYWQVFCSWSTNQFFFGMVDQDSQSINKNRPPYYILEVGNNKQIYFHSVLDKFIDQFLLQPIQDPVEP